VILQFREHHLHIRESKLLVPRAPKGGERVQLARCDLVLLKLILCFEKCPHVPEGTPALREAVTQCAWAWTEDRQSGQDLRPRGMLVVRLKAVWSWVVLRERTNNCA
jgi:hypothetical protein